jgi:hypothetical protein
LARGHFFKPDDPWYIQAAKALGVIALIAIAWFLFIADLIENLIALVSVRADVANAEAAVAQAEADEAEAGATEAAGNSRKKAIKACAEAAEKAEEAAHWPGRNRAYKKAYAACLETI